jgi:hypothetical protein
VKVQGERIVAGVSDENTRHVTGCRILVLTLWEPLKIHNSISFLSVEEEFVEGSRWYGRSTWNVKHMQSGSSGHSRRIRNLTLIEARDEAMREATIPAQTPFRHPQGHSTTHLPLLSSV